MILGIVLFSLALLISIIACSGLDGFGFWTGLLWNACAVLGTAAIVSIRRETVEYVQLMVILLSLSVICFLANYRIHGSWHRFIVDWCTVPMYIAILTLKILGVVAGGDTRKRLRHWEIRLLEIVTYKPKVSKSVARWSIPSLKERKQNEDQNE
jgi:hypothetical protein